MCVLESVLYFLLVLGGWRNLLTGQQGKPHPDIGPHNTSMETHTNTCMCTNDAYVKACKDAVSAICNEVDWGRVDMGKVARFCVCVQTFWS